MAQTAESRLAPLLLSGLEAAVIGLVAGGCRLVFAPVAVCAAHGVQARRLGRMLSRAGGALVPVQGDRSAAAMAAGAALEGARAAAVVTDSLMAACSLAGLDDLSPVLVDASGRLPLGAPYVRMILAPHTAQAAFESGQSAFELCAALRGPGLIAGLGDQTGEVTAWPPPGQYAGPPVPIHHTGPDNADLLLLGAGPGFEACADARELLEAQGVEAAHLHLLQLAPFPGAILAPALTSSRRVLVVEPGGPGTLAGLVRTHLGPPTSPFGELHRLFEAPLSPQEIAWKAQEVLAL